MFDQSLDDFAESHGYAKGRCPNCGATCWTDTGSWECESCGHGKDEPEESEEESDEDFRLTLADLHAEVAGHCAKVRNPNHGTNHSADVLVSDDNCDEIVAAVKELSKQPVHRTTDD